MMVSSASSSIAHSSLGYTEGRDFEMEYRWAEGYLGRLPALAEEFGAPRNRRAMPVVGYSRTK
jgi:hypothetical protein